MEKKKYYYIDFIRIFSMLSVIMLHVCADVLWAGKIDGVWHFSNILSALCSASVPLFFMISGAMLLSDEKNKEPGFVVRVRLKKVIIPFLFWSIFAVAYYFITEKAYYGINNTEAVIYRIKHFLSEPVVIHLWFMYALIPIYLLLPFIKRAVDGADKKTGVYFIILWSVFSVALPTLKSLSGENIGAAFSMHPQFDMNLFMGYPGFFILGYILHKGEFKIKKGILVAFILLEIAIVSYGTYRGTVVTGGYWENMKTYGCMFTASLSVALFLLFKELFSEKDKIKGEKLVAIVSASSFGIYLMHNLLINYMNINYFLVPNESVINLILRFFTVYIICQTVCIAVKYIKPLSFVMLGISHKKSS